MQTIPQSYILLLAIFTIVTAISVLIQAGVLLGMFIVLRKSMVKMQAVVDEVKEKALPAIATTRTLLEDLTPKLKSATADLTEVTHTARIQVKNVSESLDDVLAKANAQINRVDHLTTGAIDAVDHASKAIENAVAVPVKHVSGLINGLKAGVESFVSGRRNSSRSRFEPETVIVPERTGGFEEQKTVVEFSEKKQA